MNTPENTPRSGGNQSSQASEPPDLWTERPGQTQPNSAPKQAQGNGGKSAAPSQAWERGVLENLAFAAIKEQRAARRWKIFFRFLFLAYILAVTAAMLFKIPMGGSSTPGSEHAAVVKIKGTIADGQEASAQFLFPALREAFENTSAKAVILQINSPGGSPVQAGMVHDEILRLKAKHDKPVYAVIEETGASAAYYIAVAANDIYVDKASIVGSIGVLLNGFGFTGTMDKLGVERRLLTSGSHKGFLDPFSPLNADDVAHAKNLAQQIHQQFIQVVRTGRGQRIKETPETYSGLFWSGEESIKLGLADALGNVPSVARDVIKVERIVDYSRKKNLADELANRLGAVAGQELGEKLGLSGVQDGLQWR